MANPIAKGFKYLMALFGVKIDEHADPKVQIQQAVEAAQQQHAALTRQAAAVIGSRRQLEMQLSRALTEIEQVQALTRQALTLADQARAAGDEAKAAEYEQTAQVLATRLVAAEQALENLKAMHDGAVQAARQAHQAVENNAMVLQQKIAERTKLLNQLEQAKMQEQVAGALEGMSALTAPGNTPSLDEVRERIEQRYAAAMGRSELAQNTVEGRMLEVQKSTLDMAGAARLESIRAGMSSSNPSAVAGGQAAGAIGAGDQAVADMMARLRASNQQS